MNTIKTLIVDDEKFARKALRELIEMHAPNLEIIGEADGVNTAVNQINSLQPNLLFLDINLGDGTGFHVLEMAEFKNFMVIFTTAYDQYAISAFKLNALDYLLKPVSAADLTSAVEKAHLRISSDKLAAQVELLKDAFNTRLSPDKKIVLKDSESIYFVKIMDIVRCEAQGPYTEFFLQNNQKITISKSLKEYDELLEPFGFLRVHKSHLVNKDRILRFDKADGGNLVLDTGNSIPVSQRRKEQILESLNFL